MRKRTVLIEFSFFCFNLCAVAFVSFYFCNSLFRFCELNFVQKPEIETSIQSPLCHRRNILISEMCFVFEYEKHRMTWKKTRRDFQFSFFFSVVLLSLVSDWKRERKRMAVATMMRCIKRSICCDIGQGKHTKVIDNKTNQFTSRSLLNHLDQYFSANGKLMRFQSQRLCATVWHGFSFAPKQSTFVYSGVKSVRVRRCRTKIWLSN